MIEPGEVEENRLETVLLGAFFAYNDHMKYHRRQKEPRAHYYLLVNAGVANHDRQLVEKLAEAIKSRGYAYTIFQSDSPEELLQRARLACGLRKSSRRTPDYMLRRGKVTALIACGGDGTFNLVARVALAANLPMGALPTGRHCNIVRSLYGSVDAMTVISKLLRREQRNVDTATVSGRLMVGSLGIGLIPAMAHLLHDAKTPRWGFRWSRLGSRAAATVRIRKFSITIDSFSFEVRPTILNVNLLPYSVGLPLSPTSVPDDGYAEVIFDSGDNGCDIPTFVKLIHKRKYVYSSNIKLYRGQTIMIQSVRDQTIYLDGELVTPPTPILELEMGTRQLQVYC
ncbi:MAG: diacylglycerol kinase family protein [bacterium]